MHIDLIKKNIQNAIPDAEISVEGDGSHFTATIISNAFLGESRIKRQQMVYEAVKKELLDGTLHALSLKTFTKEEYAKWTN
ncbi:MAG: hypothetical protein A3F43_04180 [Gammaproteobacteria bacterium RIFCSPHIGHO2_12_FULL_42_10]|nr:MAG: hypothetical protein A3F43_04180 [Gammaproteobacteria bacterium RIFCSPHIGHO2_12_FULL_42_10]